MNPAHNAEAAMLSQYMMTGTPIAFPATSMNPESVTLDHYDQLLYEKCTSEELQWAFGSEDYLRAPALSTESTEMERSCASTIMMLRDYYGE